MNEGSTLSYYGLIRSKLPHHLECIYPDADTESICDEYLAAMRLDGTVEPVHAARISGMKATSSSSPTPPVFVSAMKSACLPCMSFSTRSSRPRSAVSTCCRFFLTAAMIAISDYQQVDPAVGSWEDIQALAATGNNRTISRHQWNKAELDARLLEKGSRQSRMLKSMKELIGIR